MNGEDAIESVTSLSDQNPETAAEQALSVRCIEVESEGVVPSEKDHGLKRKHCELSARTDVGEKKVRFQGIEENVTTCETKETKYESVHVSTKLSATLKASFFDESHLPKNSKESDDDDAVGSLPEDGKKGRRRKRGQRKNRVGENFNEMDKPLQQTSMDSRILENNAQKTITAEQTEDNATKMETSVPNKASENLNETENPLQQTSMDSRIFENNAQKTLTAEQTEASVTKMEKSVPNTASVSSKPFMKLTEKPKADKIIFKPSLSKPKPQETAKPSENPKHTEKQQLSDKKVVNDSFHLEIESEETNSKCVPSLPKPKRYKEVFMYGNYSQYYGYRSPELEEDVRLSCFPQSFFQGKEVLDIGCNIGHVTLLIARDWRPKRIVGLDIDGKLINIAKKNVKHYIGHKNLHGSASKSPSQAASTNGSSFNSALQPGGLFPTNVMFMQGNYVLARDDLVKLQKEEYDVILALSISKWIHLNFGDDGLRRTFQRVYHQLRPGGKFILEPQEWSSYKKKKKLTETIFENFKNIKFRPDNFRNYLLSDDVGFSSCELLGVPNNKSKGFRRPLLMFTKSSSQNRSDSLGETEQRESVTDEYHSTSICSTGAMTEKVIVESGEEQSSVSQDLPEVGNTHVCDKRENGATILNAMDILITQGARNEDHSVSTCLTDALTENAIIHSGELQCESSHDISGVSDTHFLDNSEDCATVVKLTDIVITKGARLEDTSTLTYFTHAVAEDASVDAGEDQSPGLQDFSEVANTHVNSKTENGTSALNTTDILITKMAGNEDNGNVIINIGKEYDMSNSASDAVTCDKSNSANDTVTCDASVVCYSPTSADAIHETSCVVLLPNNANEECGTSV